MGWWRNADRPGVWPEGRNGLRDLAVGYFGSSTGTAAALDEVEAATRVATRPSDRRTIRY